MRAGRRKRLRFVFGALALVLILGFAFSKPLRIQYHKWRVSAAKREHLRLGRGEYRFSDQLRELFLGRSLTWPEVDSRWKRHEQALVDLGFMQRVPYYAGRGKLPSKANPEFTRIAEQMDHVCPWWSYAVSESQSTVTVTATKEALELWRKLAPSVGLQEDKAKDEGRTRHKKCGRRNRDHYPIATPISADWSAVLGRRPTSANQ